MLIASGGLPDNIQSFLSILPVLVWIVGGLAVLIALIKVIWGNKIKGWFGEKLTTNLALRRLDPAVYQVFNDLYLPRPDNQGTTQIDHVVVSPFGIFVIESKNYQGWIFGSEKQRQWTQSIYGKKHRFQNPLHQNAMHVRALASFLELELAHFHSLVFFIGNSTFKTKLPSNVLDRGLSSHIKQYQEQLLDQSVLEKCIRVLQDLGQSTDRKAAARAHLKAMKERHHSL